jgi:hypothetical protein
MPDILVSDDFQLGWEGRQGANGRTGTHSLMRFLFVFCKLSEFLELRPISFQSHFSVLSSFHRKPKVKFFSQSSGFEAPSEFI